MRRKGQVTIFIILGILLLAIAGLMFYFKTVTVTETFETEGRPVTVTVPQEFTAIQEYTEICLGSIGKQGIKILSQQGGYIYPDEIGGYSISDPTNSDGILLGSLSVPYWHYNSVQNGAPSVSVTSLMPALYLEDDLYFSIEAQLSRYIEENVGACLNDYSIFENQGFMINGGDDIEVLTRVWDGHVDFIMEMPLEVGKSGGIGSLDGFYVDVDVDLKHVYEVAQEIAIAEKDFLFLESQLLDLLTFHSGEDINKFPPFMGYSTNDQMFLEWQVDSLTPKLTNLLNSYVPQIRDGSSDNFYMYEFVDEGRTTKLTQNLFNNMILPLNNSAGLDVNFDYLGWAPYLEINGGEKTIKPTSLFFESPFSLIDFELNLHKFHTSYDVSYPVLVSVYDEASFEGDGLNFIFALESNVINNFPLDENYFQSGPIGTAQFSSLACNENQLISEIVNLTVIDSYTGENIEDVGVSFSVPGVTTCKMGLTGKGGEFNSKYPPVYGGTLELTKRGYSDVLLVVNTIDYLKSPGEFGFDKFGIGTVVEMDKLKEVSLKVMKKSLNKCAVPTVCNLDTDGCKRYADRVCFFNSGSGLFLSDEPTHYFEVNGSITHLNEYYFIDKSLELVSEENVIVSLERVEGLNKLEEGLIEEEFNSFSNFIGGSSSSILELMPGKYSVSLLLTDSRGFEILGEEICSSDDQDDCKFMNGTVLNEYLTGSIKWESKKSYFEITAADLYNSDELTLFVLSQEFDSVPPTFKSVNSVGEEIDVNSLVLGDLSLAGVIENLSFRNDIRPTLEPLWTSYIVDLSAEGIEIEEGELSDEEVVSDE